MAPKKKLSSDQKKEFLETIKNPLKTYEIMLSGYGGEIVIGSITKEQFEYWSQNEDNLSEHCTDWDNALNVPEELQICRDGSWHECDNLAHECGVEFSSYNYISVNDKETGETVFECSLDYEELEKHGVDPEGFNTEEFYVRFDSDSDYAFLAQSGEKGCFYTGEIEVYGKFDPKKLSFSYVDIEGWPIVNGVSYESIIVDDTGGYSTTGKSLDFKVFQVER